jgi:hypothetical protein
MKDRCFLIHRSAFRISFILSILSIPVNFFPNANGIGRNRLNMETKPRINSLITLVCIIAITSLLSACAKTNEETQPYPTPKQPTASATQTASPALTPDAAPAEKSPTLDLTPPQPDEVRAAVARIYQKTVTVEAEDAGRAVVGDFNGDDSADLAVVVHPDAKAVAELNSELANWIVEDPHQVLLPAAPLSGKHPGMSKDTDTVIVHRPNAEERARIESGDTLLVVIHGYHQQGWRNPDARQTYLLKNAVGTDLTPEPRAQIRNELKTRHPRPDIRGDVIKQKLDNASGFLYWTGAKYGWFH